MFLHLFCVIFLLSHLMLSASSACTKEEEYAIKKTAQICFNKRIGVLNIKTSCDGLDFRKSYCVRMLKKCFKRDYRQKFEDFFLEKAIQFKQWIFLANKLLDSNHAKSVFYFFSPFLVHFCSSNNLQWFHIFYEECMHVKNVTAQWPVSKMEFMHCPSIKEYLSSGRNRVFGPVMSCPKHPNQEFNFCVQKHMNILPAKKNSSWKDACKNLKQVYIFSLKKAYIIS